MTARSAPTPNAPRWTESYGPSPVSAPTPTPTPGGPVEVASSLLPGMGDVLDAGAPGAADGTMGLDFDLNDMSWLTSAPVNL